MYELKILIAVLKRMKKPNMFIWNLLVNQTIPEQTAKFEVHTKDARRVMAPFVGKYVKGELLKKYGATVETVEPGVIKPYREAHAEELLNQQVGQTAYGDSIDSEELAINQVSKELDELDAAITRRELWMLSKYLTTGVIPILGETVDTAITFGDINKEILSGTDKWDDANSDPIEYLKMKQLEILKDTGINIDSAILTPKASTAFQNHPKVTKKLAYTTADVLRIQPRGLGDGAKYIGTIPELELDIYSYIDWVINPVTKTEETLIPEGGMIGCKSKSVNVHYGAIAQKADGVKAVFTGERIPKIWGPEGEDCDYIRLASAPLPVPSDIRGFFYSKVV